ncbi:MAG: ATP-binding protein [Planctomycetota bacterium]
MAAFATTIVYVVGTVLYGVLSGLVLKRRKKTWSEVILLLLGASSAIWYLGNALDRAAQLLFAGPVVAVVRITDVICCVGIAPIPSLLMVMALLYFHERRRRLPRRLLGVLVAAICALVLPFSIVLVNLSSGEARLAAIRASPVGQIFLGWLALALISTAWVCFRQTRRVADRREERFFRMLFWGIVGVAGAIVLAPVLMASSRHVVGSVAEVDLIVSLAGLFPGVVFAYFVYRYNYLEFVLRRSIFYGFLTLLLISTYYFLIRELARGLGQRFGGLNVALVEALLVIGLVYVFPKIGEALRGLLRLVAFRRTVDAEARLGELNREISLDPMLEPARVLEEVSRRIKEACSARNACILLQSDSRLACYGDRPDGPFGEEQWRAIVDVCGELGTHCLERREVMNVRCLTAMRQLNAHSIYPVVQEGAYRGLIAVGRTPTMAPLTEEASEQLVVMASRISSAMARAAMIQERFGLQRRLYAREKLTSLGQLAASVAHEVRNPLSSIKSLVQCLGEELAQQGIEAEETSLISEEIDRLNRTVTGLLRYARPASEGARTADFKKLLDAVVQLLRHEFERNGTALTVDVPEGLPPLQAGEDAIKEILLNLVLNALEAMPQGGTLGIAAALRYDRLRVELSDTGGGIPEAVRDRIFEPSFTTKEGGTGLGLSIVQERLEQVGGRITCRSSAEGTTMEVELPLAPPEAG